MAAKLLHSLTDDNNPHLQKQIGCLTGIFQIFYRHHVLSAKHMKGHRPKRLQYGTSHFSSGTLEAEPASMYHQSTAKGKNLSNNAGEKQRVSTESSRASFSSSSHSSSFSSIDCSRTAQPEPLSFERIIFPDTPSRTAMSQSSASPRFSHQSLDLRDVVKDSMYREVRGLSVKTMTENEASDCLMKHKDSPRSPQMPKSVDKSHGTAVSGKQALPADLRESLRVLAKFQEAPSHLNEAGDYSRKSCDSKDAFPVPKDGPRFAYDSRDSFKSTPNLKELPRLSLDSREGSVQCLNSVSKSHALLRNSKSQREGSSSSDLASSLQQTSGIQKRLPGVVAKLMGLEALPDSVPASDSQTGLIKTFSVEECNNWARSSKQTAPCRPNLSNSSKNSRREPASLQWKNHGLVMKPITSSRFPIEPAPWKQLDGGRFSQRAAFRHPKGPPRVTDSFPSVYAEIEKRLKDLEFTQSGKDFRALKQILEVMHTKGLLESRREEDRNLECQRDHERRYRNPDLKPRMENQQKPFNGNISNSTNRGANSVKTFESPIVIMKPAKLVEKSGIPASSVIPMDHLSGLPKLRGGDLSDSRKSLPGSQPTKDQMSKASCMDRSTTSTENKRNNSRMSKLPQTSTRSHQVLKHDTENLVKTSGSLSPRLQQKKLEFQKRSRPPTPPLNSNKSRRQPSNQQQPESSSPGGKHRPKLANLQQEDQLSGMSSETRNLSNQEDNISMQSDSNVISDSGTETEVTSSIRHAETNGSQSPSMKTAKYLVSVSAPKKSSPRLSGDGALEELATIAPEHPSPVSVLDDSLYKDDAPSPLRQTSGTTTDARALISSDMFGRQQWDAAGNLLAITDSGIKSEINRKKLENIERLVQKLRQLNSGHDEAQTDYIASLCENTNPDHRYISEILLTSGLILRDLSSSLVAFQPHTSGHPINPELFLVLEQTKASSLRKEEVDGDKAVRAKFDKEKLHRKLIFDAVNEILVVKLASVGPAPELLLRPSKLARNSLNAQKLLRELSSEIDHQLQASKSSCSLEEQEEEDDSLKNILWEDVMRRSGHWTEFHSEISGVVLDVERLIFKDLVDEIVLGEAAGLRSKQGRFHRQLFP